MPRAFFRFVVAASLPLLIPAGPSAARPGGAERHVIADDLEIEPVGEGIWLHVSRHPELGPANGLVVVSGGEAILIDTPWTNEQTGLLLSWVSEHLGARVAKVIVGHSHSDCTGGLANAHRSGVESYAHVKTAAFARRDGREVPKNTFERDLDIRVGTRLLEARFIGPGHTVDNIVVWIPDARVLFGGCLVRSATAKTPGYTKEADLDGWPNTIEKLLDDYGDARLIIPGHGLPGGKDLPEHTLELLGKAPRSF